MIRPDLALIPPFSEVAFRWGEEDSEQMDTVGYLPTLDTHKRNTSGHRGGPLAGGVLESSDAEKNRR